MRFKMTLFIFLMAMLIVKAQETGESLSLSEKVLQESKDKIAIGGYGHVDLYKPVDKDTYTNATLDVTRLILSAGYSFSDKTSFFTEIEFEHVKELYVEQAFINHSFTEYLNFRAGLLLIPMGIINEYHEPTSFNGVSRPFVDNLIVPTTWREIGAGFSGRFNSAGIKYQVYLTNGLLGYDGTKGLITGEKFIRDARQKGARTLMKSPDLSFKFDYFGIKGFKLGLAGYFGKTESALYKGLDLDDDALVAKADSSVLGISMISVDARYIYNRLMLRGQYVISFNSNASQYNAFTGSNTGSRVYGLYTEAAYRIVINLESDQELVPFFRYEIYDTHHRMPAGISRNQDFLVNAWIFGAGLKLSEGTVLKTDFQITKPSGSSLSRKALNAGIGVWF